MKKNHWKFLLKPGNIPYSITILTAIVIGILGIFPGNIIKETVLISIILLVLSSIIYLLLISQRVMNNLKDKLEFPSIGKVLRTYDEKMITEIKNRIEGAEEIWLLSRTGMGFLEKDYRREFEKFIEKGKARFLFLDPENGALKMVEDCQETDFEREEVRFRHKNLYRSFLDSWKAKCQKGKSDLKVTGHFPAWTLIFFDPQKKGEKNAAYVELATYHPTPRERPVFKVTLQDEYFDVFLDDFKKMWEKAVTWPLNKKVR